MAQVFAEASWGITRAWLGVRGDLAVSGTWDVLWWKLVVALHKVNFGRPELPPKHSYLCALGS